MAETLTIRTASATDVISIATAGPQGPKGADGQDGSGIETLTTAGELLYQAADSDARLPIGD